MLDAHPVPEPPLAARERFAEDKPLLGGNRVPIAFGDEQRAVLDAAADELIPPTGAFPAPSTLDVVGYVARYVTPDGVRAARFPFARETPFKGLLDGLGAGFLAGDKAARTEALRALEAADPDGFAQLYQLVLYAYYSRREVTAAMNASVEAARDLRHTPQPYGYWDVIEPWDEALLGEVGGTYIATDDVRRVPGADRDAKGA